MAKPSAELLSRVRADGTVLGLQGRPIVASRVTGGYHSVIPSGRRGGAYRVHRLVWEAFNGPIPKGYVVDHIDGNPSNNQLGNLQLVTQPENMALGASRLRSDNASGYNGVSWDKSRGKWYAYYHTSGRMYPVGRYDSPEEAVTARLEAQRRAGVTLSRRNDKDIAEVSDGTGTA